MYLEPWSVMNHPSKPCHEVFTHFRTYWDFGHFCMLQTRSVLIIPVDTLLAPPPLLESLPFTLLPTKGSEDRTFNWYTALPFVQSLCRTSTNGWMILPIVHILHWHHWHWLQILDKWSYHSPICPWPVFSILPTAKIHSPSCLVTTWQRSMTRSPEIHYMCSRPLSDFLHALTLK